MNETIKGIGLAKRPWVDLEELGALKISDFDAFSQQIFLSCARSHAHFHTAKLSLQEHVLDSRPELTTLSRQILADPSHEDHSVLQTLSPTELAEYMKLKHPVAYIGRSLNIRTVPPGVPVGKANWARCVDGPALPNFEWLVQEIKSWNIFLDFGRMVIFQNEHHSFTPIHRDWKVGDEFIWIGFGEKRFFVYDPSTGRKEYLNCRVGFFNNSDFHGTDPAEVATISLRIDGVFTPRVRSLLR